MEITVRMLLLGTVFDFHLVFLRYRQPQPCEQRAGYSAGAGCERQPSRNSYRRRGHRVRELEARAGERASSSRLNLREAQRDINGRVLH